VLLCRTSPALSVKTSTQPAFQPYFTFCSDWLEVGDVIGFPMPNAFYSITSGGWTYWQQNVALMQWFEGGKSDALGGAYSFPDASVLTSPATSQKPNCSP